MAKANLQARDDALFPLLEKVEEFLTSERRVMLVLGDSGIGKSTFSRHLERQLWTGYKQGDPIPLYINLPFVDNPAHELVEKVLYYHNFLNNQILEMKQHRHFILICDGYDESQLKVNIHTTNLFNQPGQWKVKVIISCRTQYLELDYHSRFQPQPVDRCQSARPDLFQEAVLAPFSKAQIDDYVSRYIPLESRSWIKEAYMRILATVPNLMDLVSNPFLLTLALEAMPIIADREHNFSAVKITRVELYDAFVVYWLGVNKRRLESNALSSGDRRVFDQLLDAGFYSMGLGYSTRLAMAIFERQGGNAVVQYIHTHDSGTWKEEFFGLDPEVRLLQESSPLTRSGSRFQFLHRSMFEYFFSRTIYTPARSDADLDSDGDIGSPAFQLTDEPSILQFLSDRVKPDPDFEQQLRSVIDQSKTDPAAIIGAANAITILVKAGALFHGVDLQGIKVPGADLSDGQFDFAVFRGADLTGVNFARSWLRQVDMSMALLEGVRFGELPYLEVEGYIKDCAYSPDGKMLAMALVQAIVEIYDTTSWTRELPSPPTGQWIASSSEDGTVRLWDVSTGTQDSILPGRDDQVCSVTFSPDGTQIASATFLKVRLWEVSSSLSNVESQSPLDLAWKVTYSSDCRTVLSADGRGTVQKWDVKSGASDSISIQRLYLQSIRTRAFSPDGNQLAEGVEDFSILLWDLPSGAPGPILKEHTDRLYSLSYSPCGHRLASASWDRSVRLWDLRETEQSFLVAELDRSAESVAFSPSGRGLALGSFGGTTVNVFDIQSRTLTSFKGLTGQSNTVFAYSPHGQQLAIGTIEKSIHFWDLQSNKPNIVLKAHYGPIFCIAYSSCAQWIASCGSSDTVQLRHRQPGEAESWSFVTSVRGFFADVLDIAWNTVVPTEFITGCADGSVRAWRISNDGDGEGFVVKFLWGPKLSILCADGLALKDATGLSPIYQKLLVQRGAIEDV
ncbi:hypothetical protein KI688_004031 [Linnemannia hyalina]|uniref:NACHT domain-containing protein n=1 Tax=Linnemannia hyalina TaxID=64524 RepID=A0A9P7XN45_9FUNG|nr:hypothetical protein KI688_004031 [Linnemannia hyalina]